LSFGGEISIKYFLTQAWASSLFIIGVFISQLRSTFWLLIEGALLIKLGAGPLHLWFIRIIRKCSFERFFILSTLQKLIPLFIFQSITNRIFANISIVLRILVSGIGVFNHGRLRLVLAYSSIFTVA
jgi:NADH:ubiquinone oxidoreductase subunit 2 (subunit N)